MPRYFFNVRDKIDYKDEIGVDLPDIVAAKKEALYHFGETLQNYTDAFCDSEVWQLSVTDQRGSNLMAFSFFMHEPIEAAYHARAEPREKGVQDGAPDR